MRMSLAVRDAAAAAALAAPSDPGVARTRVLRGVVLRKALILKHVQQRRFPSIVQAKEEDLGILVSQTCTRTRNRM